MSFDFSSIAKAAVSDLSKLAEKQINRSINKPQSMAKPTPPKTTALVVNEGPIPVGLTGGFSGARVTVAVVALIAGGFLIWRVAR